MSLERPPLWYPTRTCESPVSAEGPQMLSVTSLRSMDKASVKTGDVLQSDTTSYQLTGFNGEGTFGRVANCVDLNTGEVVAVKIFKTNDNDVIQSEMAMLEKVRALDPDQNNIVKFIENFTFHKLPCVVFEMLDRSLWNLMEEREWTELSLNEIRPVTQQLLVACEALKNIGIIYMDMKPDNIMFVNHKDQPFKIKLIDFGLALPVSQGEVGEGIQTFAYGAPEVILGLPFSEAVDMWGVGCIMAFMYFGMHLFPLDCPYDWMKTLDEGWRLRTSEEYKEVTAFLDLLKCCLNTNAEQRICPREALYHRFMKMAHLVDGIETNSYTDMAHKFMNVSSMYYLDESEDVSYLENSCAEDFKIRGVVDSETKNFKPSSINSLVWFLKCWTGVFGT
uniref:Protein kinase domain-containing protein n=1 Tax=Scophthalmus maximus TaxID=52904 RepID=A0A8D3A4U2_SCOMX